MNMIADKGAVALPVDIEKALIGGDLSTLSPENRVRLYNNTCDSLGLNPLTKPFEYIKLNGKLTLYARKDATEQLRKVHGVSIERLEHSTVEGVHIVTAYAKDKTGRQDTSTGAVPLPSGGEARANAVMKAETKAKRRVTLSICGLGVLDETEVDSIPGAMFEKTVDQKIAEVAEVFDAVTIAQPDPVKTMSMDQVADLSRKVQAPVDIPFTDGPDVPVAGKLTDDEIMDEFKYVLSEVGQSRAMDAFKKFSADNSTKPMLIAKAFTLAKGAKP